MAKVLITGTSSGIGYQTAMVLARAGHSVYATMRNLERGAALRNDAEREQLPISIIKMDVDSDDSVEAATSSIRAQAGCIDVLVNNAGIERSGSIEGLALDDFKATMETNYFGPLRTIRAWLSDMRQRQSGCIVNVPGAHGVTVLQTMNCDQLTAAVRPVVPVASAGPGFPPSPALVNGSIAAVGALTMAAAIREIVRDNDPPISGR